MRKTSKYLNKTFGNWTCTHVGVAVKTGAFKKGTKIRNSYPHHQTYYYIFERPTSDGKAEKLIRLNAGQAAKVYRGELSVEAVADLRQEKGMSTFKDKVSYHFYGA
jgi:hypothetical protein